MRCAVLVKNSSACFVRSRSAAVTQSPSDLAAWGWAQLNVALLAGSPVQSCVTPNARLKSLDMKSVTQLGLVGGLRCCRH